MNFMPEKDLRDERIAELESQIKELEDEAEERDTYVRELERLARSSSDTPSGHGWCY